MIDTAAQSMARRATGLHAAAAIAALPVLAGLLLLVRPLDQHLLQADSASYLSFSGMRSGGYPFFLAAARWFLADDASYPAIQVLLFAAAVIALGWQFYRACGNVAFPIALEALLLANPYVNRFHFTIMTESVFVSVSALFLAAAMAYWCRASVAALVLASLLAGYAAIVRPTGLAFLPVVIVLVLLVARGWRMTMLHLAVTIAAVGALLFLEARFHPGLDAGPRLSLLPIHAFARGGIVAVPDADALTRGRSAAIRTLHARAETDLAPVRRLIADAPNTPARCRLIANYEGFVQYQFALSERVRVIAEGGEQALMEVGMARIGQGAGSYLTLVAHDAYCLWTVWLATDGEKAALHAYLDARRPIPFEAEVLASLRTSPSRLPAGLLRPILLAVGGLFAAVGCVVVAAALARRRVSLWLALAGLCGLLLHGSIVLTAMAGVPIPRYVLALWVPLCVGLAAALLWVLGRWWPAGMRRLAPQLPLAAGGVEV